MQNKKMPVPERAMIAIGLLMVTTPTLINDWVHVPDFVRGFFVGLGLTLEIVGLVRLRKKRRIDSVC